MISHFRAFKKVTGDPTLDLAIDRAFELMDLMQTKFAPNTGLIPDWIVNAQTAPRPSLNFEADNNANEGDATKIFPGYKLDGTALDTHSVSQSYNGPIAAGAMVDASFQPFLNNLWSWNTANPAGGYYDAELQLIPMIVTSGNW